MERVLVTGLGVLCCLGSGVDAFWRGMRQATSMPTAAADPDANMTFPLMYSVPDAATVGQPQEAGGFAAGQASRYAIEAARQALEDAGLVVEPGTRVTVVVGTGMGDSGMHEQWRSAATAPEPGAGWVPTFSVASLLAEQIGATGAATSISNACAASGFGLSIAADLIRAGEADVVIAGGAEAYSRVALACFNRLGAIDPSRCRPFDAHRQGTVFGEGAAVFVLESAAHAHRRQARQIYAELAGAGWSCDAHHATAPEPSGQQIVRAMRQALDEAHTTPDDVGCVVPHGTGTELNDVVESHALQEVLADTGETPLYSLKGLIGHTGGAAGALAAAAAMLILRRRTVPPNVALDALDPECKVTLPTTQTPLIGPGVLVNAYAFGGNNVSLLLREATQ